MSNVEHERMALLLRQLQLGWQVEAPVIERVVFTGPHGLASAFEFVLRNEHTCQVIAVPNCDEIQRFLRERTLTVVAL